MTDIDMEKVQAFMGKAVGDLAANFTGLMVVLGHRLGLYAALAEGGPQTPEELAKRSGTHARYVEEWLKQQSAAGYVRYDGADGRFELPPEAALVLASDQGPAFFPPAYETIAALWHDEELALESFRTGRGVGWHEHHERLFTGTEAFFKPGYRAQLTTEWIPALTGVAEKLQAGGRVADVGCGHGASTIIMAQAFPEATLVGFDYHEASVATARARAEEAGVADRVSFEVASGDSFGGEPYDLVCFMDCLHDMGDPVGAARHTKERLAPGGSVLLVEPRAGDRLEENLHPVGALFYAASTMLCVPCSLSQEVGLGLGAQAGQARLGEVFRDAGFGELRRAAETPFNLILEARA